MHVKKVAYIKLMVCSFSSNTPVAGIQETFVFESNLIYNLYLRSRRQCNQVGKGMVFPQSSHYTSHRLNMDPLDRK